MGFAKHLIDDPALNYAGSYICPDCVEDSGLKEYINLNAGADHCDFCKRSGVELSVDMYDLLHHIQDSIGHEYGKAIDNLGWEGEYIGPQMEVDDVIEQYLGDEREELRTAVQYVLGEELLCPEAGYGMSADEAMEYSWENFKQRVIHESRYTFLMPKSKRPSSADLEDDMLEKPADVLKMLQEAFTEFNLETVIPRGTIFYRGRCDDGKHSKMPYQDIEDLCPPPPSHTLDGRMNAMGMPVFYCAAESATAELEILKDSPITVAQFRSLKPLTIINFKKIPDVPSIFSTIAQKRPIIKFLHAFTRDISQPIEMDRVVHPEYVPTQIVTEYLRDHFIAHSGINIDGLGYKSSKCDGLNFVFFCDSSKFYTSKPKADIWFALVPSSSRLIFPKPKAV